MSHTNVSFKTNIMEKQEKFIGIDVSKLILDICSIVGSQQESKVIENNERSIKDWLDGQVKGFDGKVYVCIENTGKYSWGLMSIAPDYGCDCYVVNPLHLKRSLGLIRGKNDKVDAIRIANYIKKNNGDAHKYMGRRQEIETLQLLLSERSYRVGLRAQLKTKNKETELLSNKEIKKSILHKNNLLISRLDKQIKEIEAQIRQLVKEDESLRKMDGQIQSVPGSGEMTSWNMIVKTNEFKTIKDPRKMACYAGVAPFENRSGTSVFGKTRVSLMADKKLKKLLHLGAMSAIRLENDLSAYYRRKVKEGKNKMSVLNAVRNKIIHIIFALIKSGEFYQNRLVSS